MQMWAVISPVTVQMWVGISPVLVQMWARISPRPIAELLYFVSRRFSRMALA
jgi:hypothetical protein